MKTEDFSAELARDGIFPFDPNHPFHRLTPEDLEIAKAYVSDGRKADLTIAPDGKPYIYRWHVVRGAEACVYFHMQIADDPERPLHDHPWDNMTVILAGGYRERYQTQPPHSKVWMVDRKKGDVVFRAATTAHRLLMGENFYTLSQFSTGPKARKWGFWYPDGWRLFSTVTHTDADGVSVHVNLMEDDHVKS